MTVASISRLCAENDFTVSKSLWVHHPKHIVNSYLERLGVFPMIGAPQRPHAGPFPLPATRVLYESESSPKRDFELRAYADIDSGLVFLDSRDAASLVDEMVAYGCRLERLTTQPLVSAAEGKIFVAGMDQQQIDTVLKRLPAELILIAIESAINGIVDSKNPRLAHMPPRRRAAAAKGAVWAVREALTSLYRFTTPSWHSGLSLRHARP